MSVSSNKVVADSVLSATVKYTNASDTAREYEISGDVTVSGKEVSSISNGQVRRLASEQTGDDMEAVMTLADFALYSVESMNINFNDADSSKRIGIMHAVNAFIAAVRASVSSTENV